MTDRRLTVAVTLAAIVALTLYLAWSWATGYLGFPLDDAWIHQTYARNLAEHGEWSFVIGQPSAGSTSPLWTILLALGYVLRIPFRFWTYILGSLCLIANALVGAKMARLLFPDQPAAPLLTGLACALEWHLVWAAASGMETLLFALLAAALWCRLVQHPTQNLFLTGLLGGALILTRPEGTMLIGLAALVPCLSEWSQGHLLRGVAKAALFGLGAALPFAPYVALNLHLSGTPWPNTFYAKQAEYAVHRAQPLLVRLWEVGRLPFVGAQVLLVPGLLWGLSKRTNRPDSESLAQLVTRWLPLVWVGATILTYVLLLPVTYQHGRYLIPVIPVLLIYGVGGSLDFLRASRRSLLSRALSRTLMGAAAVLFVAFWAFVGAPQYAIDVAIIEEEMVATAQWLNANVEQDALIAIHDIGAMGYFARRSLLDMAGLVSPEVVPFIRDEEELLGWLADREADYLVTFPSWYPSITSNPVSELIFETDSALTVEQGGDNMAVYRLNWENDG